MSEQILETLFDSPVKVKLLKLFLRNPGKAYQENEIVKKTQAEISAVRKEIQGLTAIGFLNEKSLRGTKKQKGGIYFSVNLDFDFYSELRNFVLKSSPASKEKILARVQRLGRIRLLLLSGIFLNTENSRLDIFIVGDLINQRKLSQFFRDLESEIGKDLEFTVMTTKEFYYRYSMFDRFVHDIFEKPNEKLINKLRM